MIGSWSSRRCSMPHVTTGNGGGGLPNDPAVSAVINPWRSILFLPVSGLGFDPLNASTALFLTKQSGA